MDLFNCYGHRCEFTMYHGDKYYGLLVDPIDDPNTHFIIPSFHKNYPNPSHNILEKWKHETNENMSREVLEKYGYEISNEKMITSAIIIKPGEEKKYKTIDGWTGEQDAEIKTKKLFIFGAGASLGMSFDKNFEHSLYCPPLVNKLFDSKFESIYQKYPAVNEAISTLRFQDNIEQYFQKEWDSINRSHRKDLLRDHINIQYYLQELFSLISTQNSGLETNLYNVLFRYLKESCWKNTKEKIAIVSFNYDTFIEQEIEKVWGISFTTLDDYVNNNLRIDIYKPHGSHNWGWPFEVETPNDISNWLYNRNYSLDEIYFELLGPENEMAQVGMGQILLNKSRIQLIKDNYPFYPALFVPYLDKDDFLLPFRHYNNLRKSLEEVEEIYIIGWKGNEASFNSLMKDEINDRMVNIYIADPDSSTVKRNLEKIFPNAKWERPLDNFMDFCKRENLEKLNTA